MQAGNMALPRLLIPFLFLVILLTQGCAVPREPAATPTAVLILAASLAPTSPPPAATTMPTATQLLTAFPTATLVPPTETSVPFLPAGLQVIGPGNAPGLRRVAELPEPGASVIAFSPDNRQVAAGLFTTNLVKVWDLASGAELHSFYGHRNTRVLSSLAYSPSGDRLASGAQGWEAADDSLIVWDAGSGNELQRFEGAIGAISPDWRLAALAKREQQETILVISDLERGKEIHRLKAPGDIYGFTFSPDSRIIGAKMFSVLQDLFAFWTVDSGRLEHTQYDWVEFAYSPDGRFLAALVQPGSMAEPVKLNVFDAVTFRWLKTLGESPDILWYTFPAFSPDGQVLAASFDDHVTLWDTGTWQELVSLPTGDEAGMAFSPDGRLLVTHTMHEKPVIWGVD